VPPFTASHTPLELLDIVRAVSLRADPQVPTTVSGRVWDAHRAPAGHPDAPRAFSIAQRLGVPWRDVLRVAHEPADNRWRLLANFQADKGRKGVTLAGVFMALRQAAHRLGQPSVNRSDYTRARELILASSRRTRHAAIAERAMPQLTQIEELLRRNKLTWEQAVRQAGLAAPPRVEHRGLPLEDAVRAFIDDTGTLPRHFEQLRKWSAAKGLAIQWTRAPGKSAQAAIAAVVAQRRAAGLPDLQPADHHMQFARAGATVDGPARRHGVWTRERLIEGMALAVELLGRGQQLDQRSLKRLARDRRDLPIPSYSTVHRYLRVHHPDESWEQWRREAEQLARSRSARNPSES
jgi:hypothetical protein